MLHHNSAPCHTAISVNKFLTKKGIAVVPQPHACLIWVHVTSSFSKNSNSTSKVVILELWTTSERSWQSSWGHFHMKTSSTATGSWSNVSSSVWLPKWTTLKGIMLICSSVVNKKNFIAPVSLLFRHTLYILIMKANEMHYFSYLFDTVLYMFRSDLLFINRSI